ncbi:MAG: hemerythrin domain-containing protein [Gammaproteobacteria bacterium]
MKSQSASKAPDAITLLTEDHKKVLKLFKDFEKLGKQDDSEGKEELVRQICTELTVHAQIEEEIFYPAVRDAISDDDLLDEAEVEHASAKDLIAQLESMQPGDELYDAKVTVLGEYINHHVKEEQGEMFPKVKKADLDLAALGEAMQQRKEELLGELDEADERDSATRSKPGSKHSRNSGASARH